MKLLYLIWLLLVPVLLRALDPGAGYDPAVHDVFASGYPASPVRNTDPSFLGAGRELSIAGWSGELPTKSFVFLTPDHYLAARHFAGVTTLTVFGADGQLHTRTRAASENLGLGVVFQGNTDGDLAMGTVAGSFPLSALPKRPGILDLHDSSGGNTPTAYAGLAIHPYGRGPDASSSTRLGAASVSSVTISGNTHQLEFSRDVVKLQSGDSGSPTFAAWTNPNGDPEYAVLGNHAAINTEAGINFDNFAASREVIAALNTRMADEGRALRVVGDVDLEWEGVDRNAIGDRRSWVSAFPTPFPDVFALYRGDTAGNGRVVNVSSSFNHRGLYFADTGSGSLGFTFSGASILEIGRGGITNYDASPQTFNAPLRLTDSQYWVSGPGGLAIASLDTNGHLLEIGGEGTVTVNGPVTGSGALAVAEGRTVLMATASHTGDTWVHEAELEIRGAVSASPLLRLAPEGTLSGTGSVTIVSGNGVVSPGPGDGRLTAASLTDTGGITLRFQIGGAAPDFGSATASVNDLLRLTGPTPLPQALSAGSVVEYYVDTGSTPVEGDVFRAGIFTDAGEDFTALLADADLRVYLADAGGSVDFEGQAYSLYTGAGDWHVDTVAQIADFGGGAVEGRISRLRLLPPEGTYGNWSATAFPPETPEPDREIDAAPNTVGLINRYSYAYALDPLDSDLGRLPYVAAGPGVLEIFYRRRNTVDDLAYEIETVSALADEWVDAGVTPQVVDADADGDGKVSLMKASLPLGAEETLRFLRVDTPSVP